MMLLDYTKVECIILGAINFEIPQKLTKYKAKEKNVWGGGGKEHTPIQIIFSKYETRWMP